MSLKKCSQVEQKQQTKLAMTHTLIGYTAQQLPKPHHKRYSIEVNISVMPLIMGVHSRAPQVPPVSGGED